MRCLICRQTEIVQGFTSIKFEREESRLIVSGVPAQVCPACGEAYVDEDVVVRLLRNADKTAKAGMDDAIEYNNLT